MKRHRSFPETGIPLTAIGELPTPSPVWVTHAGLGYSAISAEAGNNAKSQIMNISLKWLTSGTAALFAATLAIQAQSTSTQTQSSSSASTLPDTQSSTKDDTTTATGTTSATSSGSSTDTSRASSTATSPRTSTSDRSGSAADTSASQSATGQTQTRSGTQLSTEASGTAQSSTTRSEDISRPTQSTTTSGTTGTLSGTAQSSTSLTTSTQTDAQVTTVVTQIDAQGPVVVERITTQFADVACTSENARKLVDALRTGNSVTLTSNEGGEVKTATFTPTGSNLGYGEVYITLALAAEALRSAGVTGCATPEQWQAVLLGGPLVAASTQSTTTSTSATASSSSHFPGILTLRSQGQGWGQIAQTTNVQLGQVMSKARTSLNIDASGASDLSPTGRSSADVNRSSQATEKSTQAGSDAWKSDDQKGKGKGNAKGQNATTNKDDDDDDASSNRSKSSATPPSSSARP